VVVVVGVVVVDVLVEVEVLVDVVVSKVNADQMIFLITSVKRFFGFVCNYVLQYPF